MPPEKDQAMATGDIHKQFGEDHPAVLEICSQTGIHRQTDCNILLLYQGGGKMFLFG